MTLFFLFDNTNWQYDNLINTELNRLMGKEFQDVSRSRSDILFSDKRLSAVIKKYSFPTIER